MSQKVLNFPTKSHWRSQQSKMGERSSFSLLVRPYQEFWKYEKNCELQKVLLSRGRLFKPYNCPPGYTVVYTNLISDKIKLHRMIVTVAGFNNGRSVPNSVSPDNNHIRSEKSCRTNSQGETKTVGEFFGVETKVSIGKLDCTRYTDTIFHEENDLSMTCCQSVKYPET